MVSPTVSPDRVSDRSSGFFTAQKWVKFRLLKGISSATLIALEKCGILGDKKFHTEQIF
jgi:hypothetical protein